MKKILILVAMIILSNVSVFASGMYSIEDLNGMNIQANSSISKSD